MHTFIRTHTHIQTERQTYAYTPIIYTHIHTHTCTHVYTHIYTHLHLHIHIHIHLRIHIHLHSIHLHIYIHINIYSQQKPNKRDRLPLLMLEPQAWSFLLLWFLICTWTKAGNVRGCLTYQGPRSRDPCHGTSWFAKKNEIHLVFPNAYDCIHYTFKSSQNVTEKDKCFTASNLTNNLFEFMVLCPGAEAAGHRARILWVASCVKA